MRTASVYGNIASDSCKRQKKLLANKGSLDAAAHSCSWQHMSNQISDILFASSRNEVGLLSVIKQSSVRELMCGEVSDELDERQGDHFEMSNVGSFSRVVKIRLNVLCSSRSIPNLCSPARLMWWLNSQGPMISILFSFLKLTYICVLITWHNIYSIKNYIHYLKMLNFTVKKK